MSEHTLQEGDGVIVRNWTYSETRAVVVEITERGITFDMQDPGDPKQHARVFQIGERPECVKLDPQGAFSELIPFECLNSRCYHSRHRDETALDHCPQCGGMIVRCDRSGLDDLETANRFSKAVWKMAYQWFDCHPDYSGTDAGRIAQQLQESAQRIVIQHLQKGD